jgi:hypothetical protein
MQDLVVDLANADGVPHWKEGSVFRTLGKGWRSRSDEVMGR